MKRLVLVVFLMVSPVLAVKQPLPAGGFKSCKAANAAGYGDIKPAYHTRLDRDRDGVACEWSKSRSRR